LSVLVTGATGYVGGSFVRWLAARGHSVSAIVRPESATDALESDAPSANLHIYDGTLDSLSTAIARIRPECVVHVASLVLVHHQPGDVDRLIASNILFPTQLLEAMHQAGVRQFLNIGTSWEHYQDSPYNPVNLYAATKHAFEDVLEFYVQACGFKAITLKLFDTYGPGDVRPKLFGLLRQAARSGTPLAMSPGGQLVDPVFIDDVVEAMDLAIQMLPQIEGTKVYGAGSRHPLSLREVVETYADVCGRPIQVAWGGRPYRPREVMTPWHDYDTVPGWQARTPLRDGIRRMELDSAIDGLLSGISP